MVALTLQRAACEDARRVVRDATFVSAIREHEAALTAIARRLCGNQADADDLVQETYERALKAWDRYSDRGNLRSWLAAILNNRFIDRCREARRAPMTEEIDDLPAPDPVAPPAWAHVTPEAIQAALARIGDTFRSVYELHVAGKSYDDIAAELGIPKNTVGTRLIRARRKLKELLLEDLGDRS
jgi:RNA polymerase sigma-70 factor (ECF subfamily)